jgi:transcriptional regulator with PAS, ATPase and Fis domain
MSIASYNDWLSFMKDQRTPAIREKVLESWTRLRAKGADPFTPPLPEKTEIDPSFRNGFILKLIKPLAERALKKMPDLKVACLFCGPNAELIDLVSESPEILTYLSSSGIDISSNLNEDSMGTNAISIALESNLPAFCSGSEHFYEKFHCLSGAAAPFYDADGSLKGYVAIFGLLPEADVKLLRMSIRLFISVFDREMRLNRSKQLHTDLKKQLKRLYKEDTKPIALINRNGYLRQINPAAVKFFELEGKSFDEKSLDKIAKFTPAIKELAQSAIPCKEKKMEIALDNRHFDVTYEKIPAFSEDDEFLGCVFIFHEQTERPGQSLLVSEAKYTFDDIIGRTPAITMARELAKRVAETSVNVLLSGPSGTGKEMFAHSIHNVSARKKRPFIAINCAAIPGEIAESELFGYAPGSFTGASRKGKIGKLEAADKGTVFLDEIGDMPIELQAKLLRLLEERTITRIGSSKPLPVNIRIIAATNKNIPELIEKGEFREDLYYRINVSSIHLPSLADSKDDIPEIVQNFIEYFNEVMGKKVQGIMPQIMEKFKTYSWPGNIRELRNAIEFAVMLNSGEELISWKDLPGQLRMSLLYTEPAEPGNNDPLHQERQGIEESEKALLQKAIKMANGNMSEAAKILQVGRSTLYRKIRKYQLKG